MKLKIDSATLCALGYGLLIALSWGVAGCAFDLPTADPAARSARAAYGDLTINASEGSTVNITLGDGALAAADGDGEVSQPTTMTTTQSPSFSMQFPAGMDPLSAGINGIVSLTSKGMDVYAAKAAREAAIVNAAGAAGAAKPECTGSSCSDKPCTGSACSDKPCTGAACTDNACTGGACQE
jgi:hypothetical protein